MELEDDNLPAIAGPSNADDLDADRNSDFENTDGSDQDEPTKKKLFKKESSKLPSHLKGLMGEANLRYARGDIETAKKMCFEVIRQAPDAYEPYLTLSQMYETTNLKKYKGYLMLAGHLASSNVSIWCRLAEVYLQEGNLMEAVRCYSKGIKSECGNIWLHKRRIELLEQKGDKANLKMILNCKQTMAKNIPKSHHEIIINLVMEVAKEHFHNKQYNRAIDALKIPLRRIPKAITKDVINMILELLLLSGRFSECLDIFTEFCGFSFDISVTEENDFMVNSYNIPENLQVDIKMKFFVCLIKLRSSNLIPDVINKMILEDDVELVGDLYLDVVDALMQTGYPQEALKLLVQLVKSKNYYLAGVWLKYAECLSACQMPEQAIEAYFTVMALAPSHVEVLYPLAMLLLQQNKKNEALEVLSQDLSTNKLDVAVLIEQMKLLKQINDWESYWNSVELLLSRHCVILKNPEELNIVVTRFTPKEKFVKLQKMRNFRSDNAPLEPTFTSIREPTVEEEYRLFKEILQLAKDREEYSYLQKFAFMALCSKRFYKYFEEIFIIAFYACIFNKDTYHGYNIVRDLVTKHPNSGVCWNWFTLIIQSPEDFRHSRFLDRYQDRSSNDNLKLIVANYDISIGNYVSGMNYFVKDFKKTKSTYAAFMLGIAILQLYSHRNIDKQRKKIMAETVTHLFLCYSKGRSMQAAQEAFYNMGRMYQQLGIMYLAEYYYKKVFKVTNELLDEHPEVLCLKREAAYNLHHIYRKTGNLTAARNVLREHIVI